MTSSVDEGKTITSFG